jgi:hypothetical protein
LSGARDLKPSFMADKERSELLKNALARFWGSGGMLRSPNKAGIPSAVFDRRR